MFDRNQTLILTTILYLYFIHKSPNILGPLFFIHVQNNSLTSEKIFLHIFLNLNYLYNITLYFIAALLQLLLTLINFLMYLDI